MTVDEILRIGGGCGGDCYGSNPTPLMESTLVDASITLIEAPAEPPLAAVEGRSVEDVWREIVAGERKEVLMMEEGTDKMMTLEDFLAKAGAAAVEDEREAAAAVVEEDMDVKVAMVAPERLSGGVYGFDTVQPSSFSVLDKAEGSIVGFGSGLEVNGGGGGGGGRGKIGRLTVEPLDKAAAQRQRRMIKNRESAARSRERKQAYQVELESLAARLEEENERLVREKAERTKERFKQIMEKVIPVVEKRRPRRALRRVNSSQWGENR